MRTRCNVLAWMVAVAPISVAFSSCATLDGEKTVSAGSAVYSKYLFRGVPQVDALVLQTHMDASMKVNGQDSVNFGFWANMDLDGDTGNAVFPNGNGGQVTEVDFVPSYTTHIGETAVRVGITNYNFPNLLADDVNGSSDSTNEAFVTVAQDFDGISGDLTVNYDFDMIDDLYVTAPLRQAYELDARTTATFDVRMGYAGADQGQAYWGDKASGLSDGNASLILDYKASKTLYVTIGVMYSFILSDTFKDAMTANGYDTEGTVFWLGVSF